MRSPCLARAQPLVSELAPLTLALTLTRGEGGWQLTAAEARQVLALRVDFRKDTIAQLVLD